MEMLEKLERVSKILKIHESYKVHWSPNKAEAILLSVYACKQGGTTKLGMVTSALILLKACE